MDKLFTLKEIIMNEYMLIYQGGDPDWATKTSPEDLENSMKKWAAWMENLKKSDQLVTGGSPLVYSGKRVEKSGVVTDIPAAEFKELVSGYSIIRANSLDEAVAIAKDNPIFAHAIKSVEVRQVFQMG